MEKTVAPPPSVPELGPSSLGIPTPPKIAGLHTLVERTLRGLTRAKPDSNGMLRPTNVQHLDVSVASESTERAVRLMDALLKALEASGRKVKVSREGKPMTTVTIDGEQICIGLHEGRKKLAHVPTKEERERMRKYPAIHGVPEFDRGPSGKLTLSILNEDFRGVRMSWREGKRKRLEDMLPAFVEGLVEAARAKKAWREKQEVERIEWEESRKRAHEEENKRYEQRERVDNLTQQLDAWSRSCRIRQYVADLKENALQPEKWFISKIPLPEWMDWALRYADSIDPVAPIRKARETKAPSGGQHPLTS